MCCMQEFCNGGTLRSAVGAGLFTDTGLPNRWDVVLSVLDDIGAGLEYIHSKRICHGDLNPSNVLLKVLPACVACAPCMHSTCERSLCVEAASLPAHHAA
jgi:serine/threonine protein kinase